MDEKHLNQVPRGGSTPKSVPAQPAPTDSAGVSSRTSNAAGSHTEKSGAAENASLPASKPEAGKQTSGLTVLLEASRAELDKLLAETESIHQRSWRVIQTFLQDSQLRASQAVDASLARFEDEVHDRVSSIITTMLQNFDVEAGARLAARLDQGLATAKQRQHSIEQDLAVAVAENRKQLDQISTAASDGLRQHSQRLLADLQKETNTQIDELDQNARRIRSDIEQLADNFATELKKRTEEGVEVFRSRSEQIWQEIVDRAEQRIAETASAHTAGLVKQARQVVDREMSEFLNHALRRFDRASDTPSSNRDT